MTAAAVPPYNGGTQTSQSSPAIQAGGAGVASALATSLFAPGATMMAAALNAQSAVLRSWSNLMLPSTPSDESERASLPPNAVREDAVKLEGGLQDVKVGLVVEFTRTVVDADVEAFASISGDRNPIHFDEAYAAKTQFGGRIVHGMLSASHISAALARLPAVVVYMSQNMRFLAPVRRDETIRTRLEVVERPEGKRWARLKTQCFNEAGEMVLDGEAKVLLVPEAN